MCALSTLCDVKSWGQHIVVMYPEKMIDFSNQLVAINIVHIV